MMNTGTSRLVKFFLPMGIKNKIVLFFKRDGARCQLVTKIALYEITGILALRNVMNRDVHKNGKQRGKNSSKTH